MKRIIECEQSVIGIILENNDSFDELDITSECFYREDHRLIFKTAAQMIEKGAPVDLILVCEALDRLGDLERVGGLSYVSEMVKNAPSFKNIKFYEKIVSDSHKKRRLKALTAEIDEAIERKESVEDLTEKAESGLFNLLDQSSDEISHISEAVTDAIEWAESDNKGIPSGLRDVDRLINGFNKANLIIVASRPGFGKSSLTMQFCEQVAKNNSVIFFSLEMQKREIAARMIKYHDVQIGRKDAIEHLSNLKLHIDDKPAITLSYVKSQCRKVKRKHGLDMIAVDYLQLMQGKGDNRTQEVGALSRGLKGISKEFDIPVIVLSQLNRTLESRADKRPIMSDLRESGEIEADADIILFIYRDEVYNTDTEFPGIAEIICRKNRNGATGTATTRWTGELTRFDNYNGEPLDFAAKKESHFHEF